MDINYIFFNKPLEKIEEKKSPGPVGDNYNFVEFYIINFPWVLIIGKLSLNLLFFKNATYVKKCTNFSFNPKKFILVQYFFI